MYIFVNFEFWTILDYFEYCFFVERRNVSLSSETGKFLCNTGLTMGTFPVTFVWVLYCSDRSPWKFPIVKLPIA